MVKSIPMAHRNQQRQTRLTAEWMAMKYPRGGYTLDARLGPGLAEVTAGIGLDRALRESAPWRPRVDALAVEVGKVVLVEAEIRQVRNAVGHLLVYRNLVAHTPELRGHWGKPVEMVLLTPWSNATIDAMAQSSGVRLELYNPAWIADYTAELQVYWTKEYQERRAQKLALRALLGVE
jgi:hypothetical protein